jgi:WD40 repeat protein
LIQLHEYSPAIAEAAGLQLDLDFLELSAIAYSPDGRFLAVGGCTAFLFGGDSGRVYCGVPDDPSDDSTARTYLIVLDANTEDLIASLPETEPDTTITDLAFTHDGGRLFYTLHHPKSDSQLFVWEMTSQQAETYHWSGPGYPSIDISLDDRWLALDNLTLDDSTGKVSIWDLASGQLARELPAGFYHPEFSSDGTKLAVAPYHQTAVYETGSWEVVGSVQLPCENCFFALSPDLSLLATSDADEAGAPVLISDIAAGQQVKSLPAGGGPTALLVFTPDGSMLWNIMESSQTAVWNTDTWQSPGSLGFLGSAVFQLNGAGYTLREIQFADDGRTFLVQTWFFTYLIGLP